MLLASGLIFISSQILLFLSSMQSVHFALTDTVSQEWISALVNNFSPFFFAAVLMWSRALLKSVTSIQRRIRTVQLWLRVNQIRISCERFIKAFCTKYLSSHLTLIDNTWWSYESAKHFQNIQHLFVLNSKLSGYHETLLKLWLLVFKQ